MAQDDESRQVVTVTLKVPVEVLEAYQRSAERAELSRHRWMRLMLDSAAGISEVPDQLMRLIRYEPKPVRDGKW